MKRFRWLGIVILLVLITLSSNVALAWASPIPTPDQQEIARVIVSGRPSKDIAAAAASVPDVHIQGVINVLSDVPAFDWTYGCSATSAAMLFGYYDRVGYSNMYTGPANDGVCPLDNSVWGYGESPLSATHQDVDGRTTRGHVDDYWISYGSTSQDPYIVNGWVPHTSDCTADFMGTSRSSYGLPDGATAFYYDPSGDPLYDYIASGMPDGTHGMRLFAESRGYTVSTNFYQLIKGQGSNPNKGFTFEDFMAEIDAGRPVLIQVTGHTMLGFGYDNTSGNIIYIHDTWNHSDHQMTWGGSYSSGMQHEAVTVLRLSGSPSPPPPTSPTITVTSPNNGTESWSAGTYQTITWNYTGNPGTYVKIELLKNGVVDRVISSSRSKGSGGSGSYSWLVPSTQTGGSEYRVRITSTSNSAITDTSDNNFTIVGPPPPTITVTSPNNGTESWPAGTSQTITWTYTGNPGTYVKIELLQNGVFNRVISSSRSKGSGGSGSYSWLIPSNQTQGSDYKVRVTSTTNSAINDTSDNGFAITPPPPAGLTVTSPNGSQIWRVGSYQTITWTYTGSPGAYVKIELLKGGKVNKVITSSRPIGTGGSGSYRWLISYYQTAGSDYKVRVTSTTNSTIGDTSDANFSISR
jgi:hypothetical protein